ncbi:hypothetical protein CHS0354_040900 [Potamilus streckersoni]|uniref:CN hydrolase domain-containing protein n=1 Tax=Potamilus streckersoni TaxID=2493646 RepID=A0AAE0SLI2_9BIVA|nr:hypothetical protein CHS0354_040900 [Potamilus streckersoni]
MIKDSTLQASHGYTQDFKSNNEVKCDSMTFNHIDATPCDANNIARPCCSSTIETHMKRQGALQSFPLRQELNSRTGNAHPAMKTEKLKHSHEAIGQSQRHPRRGKELDIYPHKHHLKSKITSLKTAKTLKSDVINEEGARIIVFPEYGLYGLGWSRQTIAPYLEYIPDPNEQQWNPCEKPYLYNSTEVQNILSCMAQQSSIFVVANMGACNPCNKSDPKCPADSQYQYSANVVYGPNGDFLARYFKYNLYVEEKHFDKPVTVDLITFETPFGRFGTFSSLDILYHDPAITLINKMNITNIAFPTAWVDELPLLSAIEFHSSFAMGMHTNFLVANLHLPNAGYHGSGLYWTWETTLGAAYYYNDSLTSKGSLVVDTLTPSVLQSHSIKEQQSRSSSINRRQDLSETLEATINGDRYTAIVLQSSYGLLNVCQHDLCCILEYEGGFSTKELYVFGAFDGMHIKEERFYLQACVLIQCANNSKDSCGSPSKKSSSYMSKMVLKGNFTSKYAFPEVLTSQDGIPGLVTQGWGYDVETLIIEVGSGGGPLSISLLSRDYSRDK